MDFEQYQKDAERTMAPVSDTLRSNLAQELHMILGMQTEVAELADVYKKELAYGKEIDEINVKEELGDIMFYVVNMCNINDWKLEDILKTNIAKLIARYPEKFTSKNALNRDLDNERNILEK